MGFWGILCLFLLSFFFLSVFYVYHSSLIIAFFFHLILATHKGNISSCCLDIHHCQSTLIVTVYFLCCVILVLLLSFTALYLSIKCSHFCLQLLLSLFHPIIPHPLTMFPLFFQMSVIVNIIYSMQLEHVFSVYINTLERTQFGILLVVFFSIGL